jgi:hypothetical protein
MSSPDVPASEHDGRRDDASDGHGDSHPSHREHLRVESLERLLSAVNVHQYADVPGQVLDEDGIMPCQ